jgi:hypothetical protein
MSGKVTSAGLTEFICRQRSYADWFLRDLGNDWVAYQLFHEGARRGLKSIGVSNDGLYIARLSISTTFGPGLKLTAKSFFILDALLNYSRSSAIDSLNLGDVCPGLGCRE